MTTGLAILGLALCVVWLAVGVLAGFAAWFIGATFLIIALLFALRVDAVTRNILRRRRQARDREPPNAGGD
jgi:membrane protein implicated in regulation of membrane protease activity